MRRRALLGLAAASMAGARPARAAQPTELVGVLEEDPPLINPAITTIISNNAAGSPIYCGLTRVASDGTILPELAQSWEISPDGLAYRFHLRPDMSWHDDTPITAEDAKFTLENVTAKLHPRGKGALRTLDHVEVVDPGTFIIHLKRPSASLISAMDNATTCILPRHLWEGTDILKNPLNQKPIGSGPFKFVEHVPDEHIAYARHKNYFISGRPAFDQLLMRVIPDPAARVAAFEAGDVDTIYFNALPFSAAPRLARLPGVTVRALNQRGSAFMGLINVRRKPYSDVRVRQALAYGINRELMLKAVDPPFGVRMLGPVPPASSLYDTHLKDYDYNPDTANRLLDEAGYPRDAGGIRFSFDLLWPAYDASMGSIASIIQQNLVALGIHTNLHPLDRGALNQTGYIALHFDMIMESFGLGPDPDVGVERFYNSGNIFNPPVPFTNTSGYVNPEIDALFEQQRVQTDPAARRAIYDRIQEIIWRDLPSLPMMSYNGPNVFRSTTVSGLYEGADGSKESFAGAKPV